MADDSWDFAVQLVDLTNLNLKIDAGKKVGMVIAQPFFEVEQQTETPCRIAKEWREPQVALIEQVFAIRDEEAEARAIQVPFILLPEYSIPVVGLDTLSLIKHKMTSISGDAVFIGGLEGLSEEEVRNIVSSFPPTIDIAGPRFNHGRFVNLCVVVIKSADGTIFWAYQAKVRPSQWEQPRGMAMGQAILYFLSPGVAFFCQICFDHIASTGQETLNKAIFGRLTSIPGHSVVPLDYVFVPQYNPGDMLVNVGTHTRDLLHYQDRKLKNDLLVIVSINRAAEHQESSGFGRSGLYYRGNTWQVKPGDVGPVGYELYHAEKDVTSAIFRKRTQSVHVATLVPISENAGDPGDLRQPLLNPRSYLISHECDASPCRILQDAVDARSKYVECQCLPCKLRDTLLEKLPQTDQRQRWGGLADLESQKLKQHYQDIRKQLFTISSGRAIDIGDLLFMLHSPIPRNPDIWSASEQDAIQAMLSALSALAELGPLYLDVAPHWTVSLIDGTKPVVIVDGTDRGLSCTDAARQYCRLYEAKYFNPMARRQPTLIVVLRSSDDLETHVDPFQPDITKSIAAEPGGAGAVEFTRPQIPRFFICQDRLFEGARAAPNVVQYLQQRMRSFLEQGIDSLSVGAGAE